MSINKVIEKLNSYFSLSNKKKKQREEEIKKIIEKLEAKKKKLKKVLKNTNNKHEKDIVKIELEAVSKLLKKSKKLI